MSKFKLFMENFLVYGLGGIISKIVPLIMVPIITRLMPNSTYFGISDMSNTIISFASALALFGMYDAMYRVFFDKDDTEFKKNVCSTTLFFTIAMSIVISLLIIIFKGPVSKIFFGDMQYSNILYITSCAVLVSATNSVISAPTRMQNKRKVFLIVNTASSILSYSIAIPLLLLGHYYIALPLASAISGIIIELVFAKLNKQWFSFKRFDKKLLKQLLIIAVPLFPNFLVYWIFNSFDKVMITNILNVGESGIYSVGSKLGHASQLIYTAFAGGWQFFAFTTMKEKDQVKSNSLIFEYLGVISYIATILMCTFSYIIFNFLFEEEYLRAYIIAPYLFLAPLLQMLFQVACNQFLIVKKTWPNFFILLLGAILNIILNYFLIPTIGIEGAAIATLVGYIVSDIIAVIVLYKMKLMKITKSMVLSAGVMLGYIICWRLFLKDFVIVNILVVTAIIGLYFILYKSDIINLINGILKNRVKKGVKNG